MDELPKAAEKVPEEKLEQVTGSGAFDDVPTVDEHEYDGETKGSA